MIERYNYAPYNLMLTYVSYFMMQNMTCLLHERHRRSKSIYHQTSGVTRFYEQWPQHITGARDKNMALRLLEAQICTCVILCKVASSSSTRNV